LTINEAIKILGLEQPVSLVKIKQHYRAKAREYHPDASGEESTDEFVQVKLAYEVLKDKTESELNNQIFKARVDYTQKHKPSNTRGFYQLPNTILMQDIKNVIYFFYKYFKINWVDIFYHVYTKAGKANNTSKPIKYLQTIFLVFVILIGLPLLLAVIFCSSIFYLLHIVLFTSNEKFKHHPYYDIFRQVWLCLLAVLFFFIIYIALPLLIAIVLLVFTLPALCLVQISLLYSFFNRN